MGRKRLPKEVLTERLVARRKYEAELKVKPALEKQVQVHVVVVPDFVLAERERRLGAPMTLSMLLFGDPPTGFSMLDRMRTA